MMGQYENDPAGFARANGFPAGWLMTGGTWGVYNTTAPDGTKFTSKKKAEEHLKAKGGERGVITWKGPKRSKGSESRDD